MNKEPLKSFGNQISITYRVSRIKEGQIYRHYNNKQLYEITGLYRDTEQANDVSKIRIGYKQLYPPFEKFHRLINDFLGDAWLEGALVKRFTLVTDKELFSND